MERSPIVIKFNRSLVVNSDVRSFQITTDGRYVIYSAYQDTGKLTDFHSVATTGGTPVKRSFGSEATVPELTSAGNAVFTAITEGTRGLFATPIVITAMVTITDDDAPSTLDFGDAPANYPVSLADNGARHTVGDLFLGSGIDVDSRGMNSASGDSDADGEKIIDDFIVEEGTHFIMFTVPAGAALGITAARFRLSSTGGLSPVGGAEDGEVEDYVLSILDATASPNVVARSLNAPRTLTLGKDHVSLNSSGIREFEAPATAVGSFEYQPSAFAESLSIDLQSSHEVQANEIMFRDFRNGSTLKIRGEESSIDLTNPFTFDADASVTVDLTDSSSTTVIIDAILAGKWASSTEPMQVIIGQDDCGITLTLPRVAKRTP